jgi:hypothetical protein
MDQVSCVCPNYNNLRTFLKFNLPTKMRSTRYAWCANDRVLLQQFFSAGGGKRIIYMSISQPTPFHRSDDDNHVRCQKAEAIRHRRMDRSFSSFQDYFACLLPVYVVGASASFPPVGHRGYFIGPKYCWTSFLRHVYNWYVRSTLSYIHRCYASQTILDRVFGKKKIHCTRGEDEKRRGFVCVLFKRRK